MDTSTVTGRRPFSRRTSILISGGIALAIAAALLILINTFARSLPEVINQQFSSDAAATEFDVLAGDWNVQQGVYALNPTADGTAVGNANASINKKAVSANEWRLYSSATVTAETGGKDFSIIFDYVDEANYFFVNFADQGGIYRVAEGKQTALAAFAAANQTGKVYEIEIRKEDTKIKVYRDGSFLASTKDGKTYASMRVGYGSRGGTVNFDNLRVGAAGAVTNPTTPPAPEPGSGGGTGSNPTPTPNPTTPTTPPTTPTAGGRNVQVSTSEQLTSAMANAQPGDVINLADGTYTGKTKIGNYTGGFATAKAGTADKPIVLTGSRKAIITGGGLGGRYGLYLVGANYWQIKGISVTEATKGIVLDGSNFVTIENVEVYNTGQEGIHLRAFSSDNLVRNNVVRLTGQKNATYGEGLYVGSANSNWGTYTGGKPDKSDRNQLIGNVISQTGAESIDIKEGTSNGLIKDNTFDGAGMTGSWADSWIDMKGNNWTITGNKGVNAKQDGFQVHGNHLGGNGNWGNNNTFTNNTADVKADGYGFWLQNNVTGNSVSCTSNKVTNAKGGLANVACKD